MTAVAPTILVVEDESSIASFVALYLKNAGYTVRTASTGNDALTLAASEQPALIVLDLMLPDLDGIEVCKRIRQDSDVPILMLTARDEDVDKIIGLEVGADDYLTKPFNPRELVARIRSILRRAAPERRERERVVPVRCGADGVAGVLQVQRDERRDRGLVLDDEDRRRDRGHDATRSVPSRRCSSRPCRTSAPTPSRSTAGRRRRPRPCRRR